MSWRYSACRVAMLAGLAVLFASAPVSAAPSSKPDAGHYLPKSQFKDYASTTKNELGINFKSFNTKKIKFEHTYSSYEAATGGPAEQIYPTKDYLLIRSELAFGSRYSDSPPIVISRKTRKMLVDALAKVENGSSLVFFGKVEKCKAPKLSLQREHGRYSSYPEFAIMIDDVFPGTIDSLEADKDDTPSKPADGKNKAPGGEVDDGGENYTEVDPKTIDLMASKYVEKKISLLYTYVSRMPEVSYTLSRQFPSDQYFEFSRYSSETTSAISVIGKKSDKIIEIVSKLNPGNNVVVRGTLKKMTDSRYSPPKTTFYLLADDITPAANALRTAPENSAPGPRTPPTPGINPPVPGEAPANTGDPAANRKNRKERERQAREKEADDDLSSTLDAIGGGK